MQFLIPQYQSGGKAVRVAFAPNVLNQETLATVMDDLVRVAKESGSRVLHLDLGAVDLLTAGGRSGLLTLRGRLLGEGVRLRLRNVKRRVFEVIELTHLGEALGASRHEPAALAGAVE